MSLKKVCDEIKADEAKVKAVRQNKILALRAEVLFWWNTSLDASLDEETREDAADIYRELSKEYTDLVFG